MAHYSIISSQGQHPTLFTGAPRYVGAYLKPGYLEFQEIGSPSAIDWHVGDYVVYERTGRTYRLYGTPNAAEQARANRYGAAFLYENVQFFDDVKQLELCPFTDLVPGDNTVHFSTQGTISFFGKPSNVAERIQACLENQYGANSWAVKVVTTSDADLLDVLNTEVEFSVSGVNCLEVLDKVYETWNNLGWAYTIEDGKNTITIGAPNARTAANTTEPYSYGSGLVRVEKSIVNADNLGTRLFAYGSMKNMDATYYRGLDIYNAESVDIEHLMIPLANWGTTSGKPDARKAYIQDASAIANLGLIPRTAYFDGTGDLPDIHPTIERLTIGEVYDAGGAGYIPDLSKWSRNQRVDEVINATTPDDHGTSAERGQKYAEIIDSHLSAVSASGEEGAIGQDIWTGTTTKAGRLTLQLGQNLQTFTVMSGWANPVFSNIHIEVHAPGAAKYIAVSVFQTGTNTWAFRLPESITLNEAGAGTVRIYLSGYVFRASEDDYAGYRTYTFATDSSTVVSASVEYELQKTFVLRIPQIGFDIDDYAALGNGKTISMKTGMCAGRDFEIKDAAYVSSADAWDLTIYRSVDEDLNIMFPNTDYPIAVGDQFVLLDIAMPEMYVTVASNRLLAAAQKLLADMCVEQPFYSPQIDAKVVFNESRVLLDGMWMDISFNGVQQYALIDSITIDENGSNIPTYEIALRQRKGIDWAENIGTSSSGKSSVSVSGSDVQGGNGAVTSVGLSVPSGLSVEGSPVTGAGVLKVNLAPGYKIPLESELASYFEINEERGTEVDLKSAYSYFGTRSGILFETTAESDVASSPAHLMLRNLGTAASPNYALYSPLPLITGGDQIVISGTPGQGGGGGGGASYIYELKDTLSSWIGRPSVSETQVLVFDPSSNVHDKNGNNGAWKYVNASSIGGVTSVVGQTGAVTAAQIATALTSAGYKLTDHEYTNGYGLNLSNGEFSLTQAVRDSLGLADTALQAASIKTLTLKVGTTTIGSAYNPIGSSNQTLTIAESNLTALLNDNYHPLYGEHDASAEKYFWIGGAKFVWHPAVGGTDGYLELQSAIVTTGDQIVNSGTPGGGGSGGGAGYLYELGDVYHDNAKTVVLRPNGQQRDGGDVLSFDSDLGVWVALPGNATQNWVIQQISALNLGTAATYGVASTVSQNDSTHLVTGAAVWTAIDNLPEPMVFKGSLGVGGTIQALPVNGSASIGDTYKVITAGTYAGKTAKVGDTFICDSKGSGTNTWTLIPSGDEPEGTVTSVGISLPVGLALGNGSTNPITAAGSFNIEFSSGYSIPLTADVTKGVTAYGYFDASGNAKSALKLTTVNKSAWGQTYWTPNGVPTSISGDMSSVGNVTPSDNKSKNLGSSTALWSKVYSDRYYLTDSIYFYTETVNNVVCVHLNAPFITDGDQIVISGTPGQGGGGGAGFLYELGDVLTDSDHTVVKQYNGTDNAANNNLFAFNGSKWYALKLGSNLAISSGTLNATDTTYSNGTGLALSNGVFSITSAYQTDIANGASAYSTLTTSQTKNKVLASPSSASGAPSFRALVAADIPSLTVSKISDIASNYVSIATANTITAKHTFSNGILLNTASSWTSSDRAIAFSADGEDANIRYYNTDSNKGLTFNPNTGELKAAKFTRRGGTSSQFLKADGSVDSNTYLTGNQTITLSGDVSGSGTTSISVSIGSGKVTNAMLAGSIAWSKLSVSASNITSTLGTTAVSRATADADGNTISSTYVKKAGDSMSGGLAICLTPSSSYPVDRTKATLIVEDDNDAATGEVRGGNIILSRGYTSTSNQSAGAISFYGRRLSGGYRNGARIASEPTPGYTTYDRQDLVFYRSNNTNDSVPTWEESMRISSQGQAFVKGLFTYSLYVDNTASGAATVGIRFRTEGTVVGGIFVNSSNDLYFSAGSSSTGAKVLTASNYDSYALPLSAGSSYPLTGHLYLNEGLGIQAVGGTGLFVYHPTSGWTGIDSTQWGLGAVNSQGVIRSSNSNLLHYKGSSSYSIWDASNSGISTMPWACSTLSVNTSLTLPNDVSILGTLTDSTTASMIKMSTSNNIVIGNSSFAHNVNLYGTLVKFYAGGTTAIGTVSSTGLDVTGTVTASGIGTFDRIVLSNTGAVSHIEFTRASWNYISVPTDGVIAFNTGGSGSANTSMAVTPDGIRPGSAAGQSCGTASVYWSDVYSTNLYLGAAGTNVAAGGIIFQENLSNGRNGFKIAPYHAANANRIGLDFFSSNNSSASPYAPVWKRVLRLTYAGNVYMGVDASDGSNLTVYGTITSSGDQVISSDATKKKNWRDLKYGVADIAKATAGVFDWKDGKGESAGTKAQDWMHLVPQLVHGEEGHMTLAYGQIAMLNTILLARRSEDHETRIKALELENAELRKEIERLKS